MKLLEEEVVGKDFLRFKEDEEDDENEEEEENSCKIGKIIYIYRKGGDREVVSLAQRRVSLIHVLRLSPLPKTNISKLDQERGCATSKSLFIFY